MFLSILNTYDALNFLYISFTSKHAALGFAVASFYNSTSHLYW